MIKSYYNKTEGTNAMNNVTFKKPYYQWLFGGMGFHNSEATMTPIIPEKMMNERILKTFHEIRPSFSRVFGGFHNWTKEAMDHFADYYYKTFAKTGTAIYMVPGRMPYLETEEETTKFIDDTIKRLEYILNEKKLDLVQFFCVTNELSVGNTYAALANDLEKFKKYHRMLRQKFQEKELELGLIACDGSGIGNFTDQIKWATANMDEYTRHYCGHNYLIYYEGDGWREGDFKFDDPRFYSFLYDSFSNAVQIAKTKSKRFMLGEFNIHGRDVYFPPMKSEIMVSDISSGFGNPQKEAEFALMACVEELAALNSGVLSTVYWTFVDYPDPLLGWKGIDENSKSKYEVCKFSGAFTDIRYNKHGMFRWSEDGDYGARASLYSVGLMAKFFKSNSRVLSYTSDNEKIICGGVNNANSDVSLCLINLSDKEEKININADLKINKPLRKYDYICDNVPYNEFNDLQGFETLNAESGKTFGITMPAHSMTILTTDYIQRTPEKVENIKICDNKIWWNSSNDKHHAYYRVYEDGRQIASTVAEYINTDVKPNSKYTVKSVDEFGNI